VLDGSSARAHGTPAASTEPTTAPSTVETMIGRNIFVLLTLHWRVDDGQALLVYCLSPMKAVEQNGFRGLERAMATFIPRSEVFPSQLTSMKT